MSECHCAQLYSKYTNKTPNSSGNIIRTVQIVIVAQMLSTGGKADKSAWEISGMDPSSRSTTEPRQPRPCSGGRVQRLLYDHCWTHATACYPASSLGKT